MLRFHGLQLPITNLPYLFGKRGWQTHSLVLALQHGRWVPMTLEGIQGRTGDGLLPFRPTDLTEAELARPAGPATYPCQVLTAAPAVQIAVAGCSNGYSACQDLAEFCRFHQCKPKLHIGLFFSCFRLVTTTILLSLPSTVSGSCPFVFHVHWTAHEGCVRRAFASGTRQPNASQSVWPWNE